MVYDRELTIDRINGLLEESRQNYIQKKTKERIYQKTIAKKLGVETRTLQYYLDKSGKGHDFKIHQLVQIAELFNCEVGYLLGEFDQKERAIKSAQDLTQLNQFSIKALKEASSDQITFIDEVIRSCLIDKESFLYSLMCNQIEDKARISEAKQSSYFLLIDELKRKIEEEHPNLKPPTTVTEMSLYAFTFGDIYKLLEEELKKKLINDQGMDPLEASAKVQQIATETHHFFLEYYTNKATHELQVIDLQINLALYLNGGKR